MHRLSLRMTALAWCAGGLTALVARATDAPPPIPGIGPTGPIETVHAGLKFGEGPAADFDGQLYFTDVFANRVLRVVPGGEPASVVEDSKGMNGLMFVAPGRLIGCQGGAGIIANIDAKTGQVTPFCSEHKGKRFLRPNDLVVDRQGGVYFTDPMLGASKNASQDAGGVYYATPAGEATRLDDDLKFPNGILLSPDEKTLYVLQYAAPEVIAYTIDAPGKVSGKRTFVSLAVAAQGKGRGGDGATIDANGNLYLTVPTANQLAVFDPAGKLLGSIALPVTPTNAAFGGPDLKTLYVTSAAKLYSMPMEAAGRRFGQANKK